jgi:uncharacterized protein YjbI with pentapeptide repeats
MAQTIPCGTYHVEHAKLDGSKFIDVGLGDAVFDNVFLGNAQFNNVCMTKARLHDVNLSDGRIEHVNLARVSITDCHLDGMTIDGIPVTELLAAYNRPKA